MINYIAKHNEEKWNCEIRNLKIEESIISFNIQARGSSYDCYLVNQENKRWMAIPTMEISTELSYLNDVFWNSEKIGNLLFSIIDGKSIAEGLKEIEKMM